MDPRYLNSIVKALQIASAVKANSRLCVSVYSLSGIFVKEIRFVRTITLVSGVFYSLECRSSCGSGSDFHYFSVFDYKLDVSFDKEVNS